MDKHRLLHDYVGRNPDKVACVVDFDPSADKLLSLDFTHNNTELTPEDVADTVRFDGWLSNKLAASGCRYGIGGYMEHRTLYTRSELFTADSGSRGLHLGVDIWAAAGTPVYAALDGVVHSFNDNDHYGDYGPTIILKHNLDGLQLFTLYGHLSRPDLAGLHAGKTINKGEHIGHFGDMMVNGNWPPHLHFQLMFDMEGWVGDYPGVGYYAKRAEYPVNIPDPDVLIKLNRYL